MATTIDTYVPFDSGPGSNVTESSWREMMKHMLGSSSGVIRGFDSDFSTIGDSSGMQVKTSSGQCWMRGHYGRNASTRTLTIATAHATLARKDAVIIRCDFVNNRIEVDVKTGTASGSPALPSLTQNTSVWETYLATVDVPAAAVTITSGNVVDNRMYTVPIAKYSRSSLFVCPHNAFTAMAMNLVEIRSGDVVANATNSSFTLNKAGIWTLSFFAGFTANLTGGRSLRIMDGGATVFTESATSANNTNINQWLNAATTERFSVGQVVVPIVWQSSTVDMNIQIGSTFTMSWMGP